MSSIGHMVEAVNTFCGMALALTDGDYTDNLSQSFCLSWLVWFRLWPRFVKNSFVYYFQMSNFNEHAL